MKGARLACMATIEGDVRIDVPAASQVHRQVVRKACEAHDIEIDPVVRLHFIEVAEPDINVPEGDLQRVQRALEQQWGLRGLSCDPATLRSLQAALREGDWKITVAVRHARRIVASWAGLRDRVYGAAVDVGSTTIAVHLCELSSGEVIASAGAMNPQIRYGEDLMSRISYAMLNEGGAELMTAVVRAEIRSLLEQTASESGIETRRNPGSHPGRQPGHASPSAGTGSVADWHGALYAGHGSLGRPACG